MKLRNENVYNTYMYYKKINDLNKLAKIKGLKLIPRYSIKTDFEDSHLEECYLIKNLETNELEQYWTMDEEFDDGMIFSYNEAKDYILSY